MLPYPRTYLILLSSCVLSLFSFSCSNLDFAIVSQIQGGSLTVRWSADAELRGDPAILISDIEVRLTAGSSPCSIFQDEKSGFTMLRSVILSYPTPNIKAETTRINVGPLRLDPDFERCRTAPGNDRAVCDFNPNESKIVKLVVAPVDQGFRGPSIRVWREICREPDKVELFVMIRCRNDAYSAGHALPSTQFQLRCDPP